MFDLLHMQLASEHVRYMHACVRLHSQLPLPLHARLHSHMNWGWI